MKTTYVSQIPAAPDCSKNAALSCRNCSRLIEIEGEMLCYRGGKITELKPVSEQNGCVNILCDGWQTRKPANE
ncbi:hypothetical protein [Shewanella sp. YIC-542]|uniref:hypothetical protein n=1 Tax=Shewanella mytili TaxID=3377111 RepID=UPI00398E6B0D